ncbi:MAG: hypothetical protein ACTHKD_10430 [Devosia sp.]|nr:hypothetical protein [Devosia sp.]
MREFVAVSLVALSVAGLVAVPALAAGNLASNGEKLELRIDTENLKFSQNEFDLETGKFYRMDITVDDADDTAFMAPELWRNVWINQIVVNDLELKTQVPYSLEWDAAGTFNVSFVPIRPGEYDFWIAGYEDRGLKGKFVVK